MRLQGFTTPSMALQFGDRNKKQAAYREKLRNREQQQQALIPKAVRKAGTQGGDQDDARARQQEIDDAFEELKNQGNG